MICVKLFFFVFVFVSLSFGQIAEPQNNSSNPIQVVNSLDNISLETTKISKSLATLNKRLKDFLEQSTFSKNSPLNERQQKLLLGFEILNRAEQRLEILQKFQIELSEKEASVKTRLAQIEQEARPESIDRNIAFVGTTKTDEMRDSRRRSVEFERNAMQNLLSQIQRNLVQTTSELRSAELLVQNLRKKILPQIELEVSDL